MSHVNGEDWYALKLCVRWVPGMPTQYRLCSFWFLPRILEDKYEICFQ